MTYPPDPTADAMHTDAPSDDLFKQGLEFHNAICVQDEALRDRTAFARLCDAYFVRLISDLRAANRGYHIEATCTDAVTSALMSYQKNPAQYKPELSNALSLYKYLLMAARGDFKNLIAREKKHDNVVSLSESVDIPDGSRELEREVAANDNVEQEILDAVSPVMDYLDRLLPDALDRELVRMILDGVRETEAFAEVLGISHLSADEQARAVKKHKDRIKKRVQRSDIRRELLHND